MKYIILTLILSLVMAAPALGFFGLNQRQSSSSDNGVETTVQQRVENKLEVRDANLEQRKEEAAKRNEIKTETREQIKEKVAARVRKAVIIRYEVISKLVGRVEGLLNKLQVKVEEAKADGKDMQAAEDALGRARGKIDSAKVKLADIDSKKDTALERVEFNQIQRIYQGIHQDLKEVHQEVGKVIRVLKNLNSLNSATTSAVQE